MPVPSLPRGLLDRYALRTRARGTRAGERPAREAGQSVEFLDYRPYQPGDEPRAVDWRAYARSGRLYTRLYRADRAAEVHLVLDTSPSMRLYGKRRFAEAAARLLTHLARYEASGRVHLLGGDSSRPARNDTEIRSLWGFLEQAPATALPEGATLAGALAELIVRQPTHPGAAAAVVLSDLLDPAPLRPALTALRARRVDAVFVQLLARQELDPDPEAAELADVEDGATLEVGPDEARAYREAVRTFIAHVRSEIADAGQRHVLIEVPADVAAPGTPEREVERQAFQALLRRGVIARR